MTHGNLKNRLLQFITVYCLLSILQLNILVTSGQEFLPPLNEENLRTEENNNSLNMPFSNNAVGFPRLQTPPEGEDDPEIIGIDEAPVSDALPCFLVLCGIYCFVIQKKK